MIVVIQFDLCHWLCLSEEDLFRDASVGSRSSCVGDFFSSYSLTGFWKARSLNIRALAASWGLLKYLLSFIHKLCTLFLLVNSDIFPLFLCSEWDPWQSAVHTPFCKIAKSISHQPRELEETQGKTNSLHNHPNPHTHGLYTSSYTCPNINLRSFTVHLVHLISCII